MPTPPDKPAPSTRPPIAAAAILMFVFIFHFLPLSRTRKPGRAQPGRDSGRLGSPREPWRPPSPKVKFSVPIVVCDDRTETFPALTIEPHHLKLLDDAVVSGQVGEVFITMPGDNRSSSTSFMLVNCFITFSLLPPHCMYNDTTAAERW